MSENDHLYTQIIAAGEQAGLYADHESMQKRQPDWEEYDPRLTNLTFFTLRPVEEYYRNYRPSWTQMKIKPVAANEMGDDALGVALVFETHFHMAIVTGDDSTYPMIVIEDMLERITDFAESYPVEAANIFVIPFQWDMAVGGEIIFDPTEDDHPILDFDMHPTLEVHVLVLECKTVAEFDQALAALSDDSAMGQAIQDTMQRLALFFRWLDTETPPRPPLLTLLDL